MKRNQKRGVALFAIAAGLLLSLAPTAQADVLFPLGSSWEYLVPVGVGTAADPALVDPDFNTTFMTPGSYNGPAFSGPSPATIGYGVIDLAPGITTSVPDPGTGNRYTGYFRRTFTTAAAATSLNVDVLADDGGIMYIDGIEVGRINFAGAETFGGFTTATGVENALTNVVLSLPSLAAGTHTFAMSVHQANNTSSDLGFNLALNGTIGVPPVVNPIQVPLGGITENFTAAPPVQQWSQLNSAGASGTITAGPQMDTLMNTLANTNINTVLATVTGAQAASGTPNYNSTNGNIQTGMTGNAAGIVMASLQNATGSNVTSLAVTYDLGLANTGGTEEIFGHTVYYSTTGATGSWTTVGTFGTVGGAAVQAKAFNLPLGSWANGANLYLAFTDDNGSGSPDQFFTIDNVNFTPTLAGGGITEPIAVTSTPASGTVRAAGQTVQVANAAAGAGNTRDGATLSGLAVTTSSAGTFSQSGLSNGVIAAGSSQTGTVAFNGAGLLNGYQASGTMAFNIASGPNGAGTGAGAYSYPLTATVTGNVGNGTAPVAAAGSYAGLSSTSGLVSAGGSTHLNSTATILGGTNSNGGATTVSMTWSLRALNEQRPGFTNPPLPNFASALTSDRVDLTGTDGDIFVLQMSYDPAELLNSEATDAADGQLFLASFNTASGAWVNAVSMNHGVNTGATNVQGGWATAGGSTLALGAWGVDIANNVVWAVLDHNSLFASVPEPSTIVMGLMGLVGLVGFARRRKA